MSNVKMPEPVAYMSANGYLMNFTSHPENHTGLITTEQAEAYAQAVRDEALEEAAKIAEKASRIGVIRSLEATHKAQAAIEIAAAIHALKEQS